MDFLPPCFARWFPWVAQYQQSRLASDLIAGVIVAILVIPQSLAYALLAGLPPQAGLYVSTLPVIVYALFGSSMTQAVGPVAITAIMTFSVLSPLFAPGSAEYISMAATLCLFSGALIFAAGLLRLGFLSQLLSRPVVSGFISGSAVLIILSQIKYFLGIKVSGADTWHLLSSIAQEIPQTNFIALAFSLSAFAILYISRRWLAKMLKPLGMSATHAAFLVRLMPLIVLAVATLIVIEWDLDKHADAQKALVVVGGVKEGLASFSFFIPGFSALKILLVPALIMALIGMVQNITMAKALAIKRHEQIDANRELLGLGASNLVAAFYGGMPVGGGLSRTVVNVAAGAQSPLASIITAISMLLFVAMGTHWLDRLPLAVLAANIVIAATTMIDIKAFRQAWQYDRADAMALLGTASGVILISLEFGIALGIGLSLITLLMRASNPHMAVVGRIAGTEHFRNIKRHQVETLPGVLFLRVDESLFFGNLDSVETRLRDELTKAPNTHDVVLLMNAVNRIDMTALDVLIETNQHLSERNIQLHLAEVKGPVQDRLLQTEFLNKLSGRLFLSVNQAFEALKQ